MESKVLRNILVGMILLTIVVSGVFAFNGTSSSYTIRSKFDFGPTANASSLSFTQRLIGGEQPVANYTSSSFTGRFGILNSIVTATINITSPLNNQELLRGGTTSGEDDLGILRNNINLTAKVFDSSTFSGISGATCYFFEDSALLGNSLTNSSGDCILDYNISVRDVGKKDIQVNYSYSGTSRLLNQSAINLTVANYVTTPTMGGLQSNGKYYDGDIATLTIEIKKNNGSVSNLNYDPQNISATAMKSDDSLRGIKYYPGDMTKLGVGQYITSLIVNYSSGAGAYIKWEVNNSDDSHLNYLGSVLHSDVGICQGDFGAWSAWSPCVGSSQTRSRTDSTSCVEVESQSCGSGGGGGGGGCSDDCSPSGSSQNTCSDSTTLNTRTCGNYDSDSCLEWSAWSENYCGAGKICEGARCVQTTCDNCVLGQQQKECLSDSLTRVRTCGGTVGCSLWGEWATETCGGFERCYSGVCASCIENWVCKAWSTCVEEIQIRTCEDKNTCGTELNKPDQTQSCISGIEIDYSPKELNLILAKGDSVGFNIEVRDLAGEANLAATWLLNSQSKKQDIGIGSLSSSYSESFEEDSEVKAEIVADSQIQHINWNIEINENASLDCIPNWDCDWTDCEEGDVNSYPFDCVDLKYCNKTIGKPEEEKCGCYTQWNCSDWSSCGAKYDINDVLEGSTFVQGYKEKICEDLGKCKEDKIEELPCGLAIPITSKKTKWCYEDYVEIYDAETSELVSRIKEKELIEFTDLKKVDISLTGGSFTGYCDYCYDGVKNYDEVGVDCGGDNCPECLNKKSFFDWLFWAILVSWMIFGILIMTFVIEERRKINLQRVPETIFEIVESAKFDTRKEKKLERKITRWFKRLVVFPSISFKKRRKVVPIEEIKPKIIMVPVKSYEEKLLAKLKRQLRIWKAEGYYGTANLKKEVIELEHHVARKEKKFVRKIILGHQARNLHKKLLRDKKRKERLRLIEEKRRIAERKKLKKIQEKAFSRRARARREHKIFLGIALWFKHKKSHKRIKKQIKVFKKIEKKKSRKEKKEFRKIQKKARKSLRKQIKIEKKVKKIQIKGLKRKLKLWKKQGYYGTATLELELKKLREK